MCDLFEYSLYLFVRSETLSVLQKQPGRDRLFFWKSFYCLCIFNLFGHLSLHFIAINKNRVSFLAVCCLLDAQPVYFKLDRLCFALLTLGKKIIEMDFVNNSHNMTFLLWLRFWWHGLQTYKFEIITVYNTSNVHLQCIVHLILRNPCSTNVKKTKMVVMSTMLINIAWNSIVWIIVTNISIIEYIYTQRSIEMDNHNAA